MYLTGKEFTKRGGLTVARGDRLFLNRFDLGTELIIASKTTNDIEEVLGENVKHYFPDGSYIIGKRVRFVPYKENEGVQGLINIEFDAKRERNKLFEYIFSLKPTTKRLLFEIEEYVRFNDEINQNSRDHIKLKHFDARICFFKVKLENY